MANVKISGLTAGVTPVAADLMEGEVAAGSSVKWTLAQLWASMGFTSDRRLVLPAGNSTDQALQIGNRLFYDDGAAALVGNSNLSLIRAAGNQTLVTLQSDNTTSLVGGSGIVLRRLRSTGAPSSTDQLGLVAFAGVTTGSTSVTSASIEAAATQNFAAAAAGTRLSFKVTAQGSVTRAEAFGISDASQLTRGASPVVVIDPDGGYTYPTFTAANIASAANAINTTNKRQGKTVYDSTNHRLMVADGSATTSLWYVADGSASVTPV